MTAEIAIMNANAVALAADSAVTVGRERVWKHANKLFSLGPHHDIGVMIYGFGSLSGCPWETVFKLFREEISQKEIRTVEHCASFLRDFIKSTKFSNAFADSVGMAAIFIQHLELMADGLKN